MAVSLSKSFYLKFTKMSEILIYKKCPGTARPQRKVPWRCQAPPGLRNNPGTENGINLLRRLHSDMSLEVKDKYFYLQTFLCLTGNSHLMSNWKPYIR